MELHFDELEAADDLAVEIIEQEVVQAEMPDLPNFAELDGEDKPEPITNLPVFDELNELDVEDAAVGGHLAAEE